MNIFSKYVNQIVKTTLFGASFAALSSLVNATRLRSESMHDADHTFTKAKVKFGELVTKCYGGDGEFELRMKGELSVEKNYVTYLFQGFLIDYKIKAPWHMTRISPSSPLMDMSCLVILTSGNN